MNAEFDPDDTATDGPPPARTWRCVIPVGDSAACVHYRCGRCPCRSRSGNRRKALRTQRGGQT